eukprot:524843-Prymnesium_polylepis.1
MVTATVCSRGMRMRWAAQLGRLASQRKGWDAAECCSLMNDAEPQTEGNATWSWRDGRARGGLRAARMGRRFTP